MASIPVQWRVSLSDIDLGPEEEAAVLAVLRSRWLSSGARTLEFESAFAERVGARHAIAVSSATAALHLALLAVGVRPGDEVIVPSLTFVATANAVLYCGATPVFADIVGIDDLRVDPRDIERKITSRTRVLVPMHYAGYPCDMDSLQALASARGLRLVDDAAHAPGASWRGRPVGSIGDASCFSFFANKNLVTGEGGMVTTGDDGVAEMVRLNRSHGMTAVSYDKHRGHAFSYDVVSTGYNYRTGEIQSALGLVQLSKLEKNNGARGRLTRLYHERLHGRAGLTMPFGETRDGSAFHIMPVVLPETTDRKRVQERLKAAGIQTSIHYPPVHRFSSFRDRFRADVPVTEAVAPRLLTLPLHPLMTDADVDLVCEALVSAVD